MELKGENPFKIRAFERAAASVSGHSDLKERAKAGTLTDLPGIGKGIAEALTDYLLKGESPLRNELRASLPEGLEALVDLPGLGPKKARHLIDELGVHSIGELEYACRENRLVSLKGFGEKATAKILESIAFYNANQGYRRLDEAERSSDAFLERFRNEIGKAVHIVETGALRRKLETIQTLEFLVKLPKEPKAEAQLRSTINNWVRDFKEAPVRLHYSSESRFGYEWAKTTGEVGHWKALGQPEPFDAPTEAKFYEKFGLPWIAPEMRETGEEVAMARAGQLDPVLDWNGVRGIFHNHTVYSDGAATVEEMVLEAKRLGYHYIGISDHSQSAFYARGLKTEDLAKQEKEIRKVQDKHPEIRIFWGIESDILVDGSLDYEEKILKKFDFVVASIHSRFQMEKEAMTQRVLEAIRNPHTRFLGHMTGRILLGRKGFELETEKVIEEAARNRVAIEINAHPSRLDIDWRWGATLRKYSTHVSINPDAHEVAGIANTIFGVAMARKALLPQSLVVNSRSVKEIERWLRRE